MAAPHTPVARIALSIHEVAIQVEYAGIYPDLLDDVTNRAKDLLNSTLLKAQEMKIDIRSTEFAEFEDNYSEDEDEEA